MCIYNWKNVYLFIYCPFYSNFIPRGGIVLGCLGCNLFPFQVKVEGFEPRIFNMQKLKTCAILSSKLKNLKTPH